MEKLTTIFEKQLLSWCDEEGLLPLAEIKPVHLERFRNTWNDGPLARKKKQERINGFFFYCMRMGWIHQNPALMLGKIKASEPPTDYFPKEEFDHIFATTYRYQPKGPNEGASQAECLRTLILLMRWSGLAIRDAVTLERHRLNDRGDLLLYRAKTGHPVYVPLPEQVAVALRNIPPGKKTESALLLLVGKRTTENCGRKLATQFPPSV